MDPFDAPGQTFYDRKDDANLIRIVGAALLMAGCGGFGFTLASARRREITMLRKLINALQEMEWELKYRMPVLAGLCRIAADASGGVLRDIFLELADKLIKREVYDISACMNTIVVRKELPRSIRRNLRQLGTSLGRYDLEGQLQGLESIRRQCRKDLKKLEENSEQNLRNYQTLALCAGTALAIILI